MMTLLYTDVHVDNKNGNIVEDLGKEIEIKTISELAEKIQEFANAHPNAKVEYYDFVITADYDNKVEKSIWGQYDRHEK